MASAVLVNRDRSPLTREQMRATIPAIFATAPHDTRTDRYLYVPTIDMLDSLTREGFAPVWASQSRVRDGSREGFQRHMVRLARPEDTVAVAARRAQGGGWITDGTGPVFPDACAEYIP